MLASKWMINRIGLIDFWYYDEEEFYFREGRMLLRGANGSGKSVTMQSFIPLLLDGNKAAERLDPFGTKARRLENYLLEENDGREERTGYLYMEFKRKESDTYVTIGIGLCAKRNKKLDSWHFVIRDGRRVGRDFFLYKDLKNKITLSKTELVNRLSDGGEVIEGQNAYMRMVNETLFGYENVEEYKELVDLLIQLRTPKLSKDYKPTILNEILSNSLPPLSDEDLRPMSEAIENMDNLKTRLVELEAGKKAADRINDVYQNYNRVVLYEKAAMCVEASNNDQKLKADEEHAKHQRDELIIRAEEEVKRAEELKLEQELLQKKRDGLERQDISQVMKEKQEAEEKLKRDELELKTKRELLEKQEGKEKHLSQELKQKMDQKDISEEKTKQLLEEMGDLLVVLSFDEHTFLKDELVTRMEEAYSYQMIKNQMSTIEKELESGIQLLQNKKRLETEEEEMNVALERLVQQKHREEVKREQLEEQCRQVKSEWQEHFYQWNRTNQYICLSEEQEHYFIQWMNGFDAGSDSMEVKEKLRLHKDSILEGLLREKAELVHRQQLEETEWRQKLIELDEWINKKDPEPEREESVHRNRIWLEQQGIPFYPFYKVVDFILETDAGRRNHLEEALYCMGVLDAIIVPSNYQSKVLESREGMKDTYIFGDIKCVAENLGKLLEISVEIDDIIFYQELAGVLAGMGTSHNGHTWIQESGVYGMGILAGTITEQYEARFIGVRAREKYRQTMLKELENAVAQCEEALAVTKEAIRRNQEQQEAALAEYQAFPSEADVLIAVKERAATLDQLHKLDGEIKTLEEKLRKLLWEIQEISLQISAYSKKLYIKSDLKVFQEAQQEAQAYGKMLNELELAHTKHLHLVEMIHNLREQEEEIRERLDQLRYDLGNLNREITRGNNTILLCEGQLREMGFEEIRQQLEECIRRLREIPDELQSAYEKKVEYLSSHKSIEEKMEVLQRQLEISSIELRLTQRGFQDELSLGLVKEVGHLYLENDIELAKLVAGALKNETYKSSQELSSQLQQKFYENLSELVDYNLTMNYRFEKSNYTEFYGANEVIDLKRLLILAKYKGKEVNYPVLVQGLAGDIDIQKNLVKESDRELFEDVLANTISKKIRYKIYKSEGWVEKMNQLMGDMDTSSGLKLSLVWKKKKAEEEGQLDTKELVELLKKDAGLMQERELEQLSLHFQSKLQEARRIMDEEGNNKSFHAVMKEVLDYRKWFEFQLYYQKTGEFRKEMTNNAFFTFSGGEKAMAMYVPLFSAVVAKYNGARSDAPRLVSLDEAFAGVDEYNIRDMFRLMVDLEFEFIINSQILWGDCDTVPDLAIYQLLRKENAKYVTVLPYVWNGKVKRMVQDGSLENGY